MSKLFFKADLPLPPSINHYWGKRVMKIKGRNIVKVYLTAKAKQFRADVIGYVANRGSIKTNKGRIKAVVKIHPKTRHDCDLDNFNKGLFDALTHARVYQDDSQIDKLEIERGEVIKGGLVSIELYEVNSGKD